jgi:beta-glucosidase
MAAQSSFPRNFLWGSATAGHQIEGSNTNSDYWLLENLKPTLFKEPSGDACNSFELWRSDLDLAKFLGLNAYRFSIEWSRIEPEPGQFSVAMLDHYKAIIDGCRERGLVPMVTFSHWTVPLWFAARGNWTVKDSSDLFARFCDRAMRHLGDGIGYAVTLNEPNGLLIANALVPPQAKAAERAMQEAARKATNSPSFVGGPAFVEILDMLPNMLEAHKKGKAAIKAVRSDLPVGATLAVNDDVAIPGGEGARDAFRKRVYGAWLEQVKADDFVGVQNYHRATWGPNGITPPAKDVPLSTMGLEISPASLAGAARYVHEATGRPILVTEHGYYLTDDALRTRQLPLAIGELKKMMDKGIPVLGYVHWSLIDNFEWTDGYEPRLGLASVDRNTFKRTLKPSALVFKNIVTANAI